MNATLLATAVLVTHGVSTDERLRRLEVLDLTNVRRKLMEPEPEGRGWTATQALEAEKWYKRYLTIIIKYPNATQHVPNLPIDLFWHQHILDLRAYLDDCQRIFGRIIYHYPYFGMNGDAPERDNAFDETNALYRDMFGEDCTQMVERYGGAKKAVNCHGEGCAQGCQHCGRDSRAPVAEGVSCVGVGGVAEGSACSSPDPDTGSVGCSQGGTSCKGSKGRLELASPVGASCGHGGSTGCGESNCRGSH